MRVYFFSYCIFYVGNSLTLRERKSARPDLEKLHIENFNNDVDAEVDGEPRPLRIETNYVDNDINIVFMSLVLNHISVRKGDRHRVMRRLFAVCKPGGAFVLFEFGDAAGAGDADQGKEQLLTVDGDEDKQHGFANSYGFTLEKQIMQEEFGDVFWIFLFRNPASAVRGWSIDGTEGGGGDTPGPPKNTIF